MIGGIAVAIVLTPVDVMRGIPLLILLDLIGFGVPALQSSFLPADAAVLGGAALALNYSAYVSGVFRAGIESVHPSEPAAGARARADTAPVTATRGPAAGRADRGAAAVRRLHLADEGRRADLGARAQGIARVAQISSDLNFNFNFNFNFTPFVAAAAVYLLVTIPLIRIVDRQQASVRQRVSGVTAL